MSSVALKELHKAPSVNKWTPDDITKVISAWAAHIKGTPAPQTRGVSFKLWVFTHQGGSNKMKRNLSDPVFLELDPYRELELDISSSAAQIWNNLSFNLIIVILWCHTLLSWYAYIKLSLAWVILLYAHYSNVFFVCVISNCIHCDLLSLYAYTLVTVKAS